MIVAGTKLVAYLLIKGPHTPDAEAVYEKDSEWAAPLLWQSEFRNVLVLSFRRKLLSFEDALRIMDAAGRLMDGRSYQMDSSRTLRLAADSGCTAYDCEFVALAQELKIPLVTADRALVEKFGPAVVSMKKFCS